MIRFVVIIIRIVIGVTFILQCGCGTVFEKTKPNENVDTVSTEKVDNKSADFDTFTKLLIKFVAESPEGAEMSISGTIFGPDVDVEIGPAYTSALGEKCKQATISNAAGVESVAVCFDGEKWTLAPRLAPLVEYEQIYKYSQ